MKWIPSRSSCRSGHMKLQSCTKMMLNSRCPPKFSLRWCSDERKSSRFPPEGLTTALSLLSLCGIIQENTRIYCNTCCTWVCSERSKQPWKWQSTVAEFENKISKMVDYLCTLQVKMIWTERLCLELTRTCSLLWNPSSTVPNKWL